MPSLRFDRNCDLSFFVRIRPPVAEAFRSKLGNIGGRFADEQICGRCYVKLPVAAEVASITSALGKFTRLCAETGVDIVAIDLDAPTEENAAWFCNLAWF